MSTQQEIDLDPMQVIADVQARQPALAGNAIDPLIGPRPDWWWTGASPDDATHRRADGSIRALPALNTVTCTRDEVMQYFANGWYLNEVLFAGLRGEPAFMRSPYHSLRHPMIFYYGHTACLAVNKLRVAGLIDVPVNRFFEQIFEVGVDEMSWDDMSKNEMVWPSVREVNGYRATVFEMVRDLIANHPDLAPGHPPITPSDPLWALLMLCEHERIHLETSSVLMREMPLAHLQRPASWPPLPASPARAPDHVPEVWVAVAGGTMSVGKPIDFPSYGWDNEYGHRSAEVGAFEVSQHLVTNGQFLAFVAGGGYHDPHHWSEEGWTWRGYRNTKWPTFWVAEGPAGLHRYRLRTLFEVIEMPLDWPVCVNFHEAKAYLAWLSARDGRACRLPTEAEHGLLRRGTGCATPSDPIMKLHSDGFRDAREANLNLAFGSECPVSWSKPGPFGVHDVAGNVWDWCEDDFHPLAGFEAHRFYDDFSTPCFDSAHKMILGGSYISAGDEASVWARFHFRKHFFQNAGFHVVVAPSGSRPSSAVLIQEGRADKYQDPAVLDQYLLFHHGSNEDALPAGMAPAVGRFPQRCAALLLEWAARSGSGLECAFDVGCAVGGATFALAEGFQSVVGVDYSEPFVAAAQALGRGDTLPYRIKAEGRVEAEAFARVPSARARERARFRLGDACALPADDSGFDAVLAANLLCRLPQPRRFLDRLGGANGLVKVGGLVMFASPFSWLETFTPVGAWLGGFHRDASPVWSSDGLQAALGEEFELMHREDFPFMIREHRRKFEYVVSDVTVWRRKPG